MDIQLFADLLTLPEGETLDFKEQGYRFAEDYGKAKFIKDVISMANTPRDTNSHIVIGVRRSSNGTNTLIGITEHPDDELLQSQLTSKIVPVPRFWYEIVRYQDLDFGVITIPPEPVGPFMAIRNFGQTLLEGVVYFRRGSKNDIAFQKDLGTIMRWMQGENTEATKQSLGTDGIVAWDTLTEAVHGFSPSRHYVLVSSLADTHDVNWGSVGLVPWDAVFDFDPNSDTSGLLAASRSNLEARRQIYLVVENERPVVNLQQATLWFFTRGLAGRQDTLELGPWRSWQARYGNELREQLGSLAGMIAPRPVIFVIAWYDHDLTNHLDSFLQAALGSFGTAAAFVIINADSDQIGALGDKYDAVLISMRPDHLSAGIRALMAPLQPNIDEAISLPSSSGPLSS